MSLRGEKLIPEKKPENGNGKENVPEEPSEKIHCEIEEWFDTTGAYKSSTDLRIIKNRIDSGIKQGKSGEEGKIWSLAIRNEITRRQDDPVWKKMEMDPRLDELTNEWLGLARNYGGEKNIPKGIKEAWERKKDELTATINLYREELEGKKSKKEQSDIEEIEQI